MQHWGWEGPGPFPTVPAVGGHGTGSSVRGLELPTHLCHLSMRGTEAPVLVLVHPLCFCSQQPGPAAAGLL